MVVGVCEFGTASPGYFTNEIAQVGLIGPGLINASPIVAPPGGKTRLTRTDPIAFSVPDGQSGVVIQFDKSTTTLAPDKIARNFWYG